MRESATKLCYFIQIKKHFLLIFNVLLFFNSSAQPYFEIKFGTAMDDRARAVQQLADGSIYVAGFSNGGLFGGFDVALTKISPAGSIQWTQYYGKQHNEYTLFMNKTSDNSLILCGESHNSFSGVDAWMMKIDSTGFVLWENGISTPDNESFKYVEETDDGGFILGGFQSDSSFSNDILIVKTDSVGEIIWQKRYGGTDNDYADAVKQTSDGGYLISADTKSFGLADYDIYMLKIDSAGNFEWDNFSGTPYADGCQGFIITSDHSYFTFGESIVDWNLPYQYFLQLTDSSGTVIWEKYMGGLGADAGFSAVETPDSGFIVTGYSNSHDINSPIDLVLFKVSKQGDSLWSIYYGGAGIDIGYHIINCMGGGYLVAGTTWQNDNDFYLLKVDETGVVSTGPLSYQRKTVSVYPNPSNGIFDIDFPEDEFYTQINVFNLLGSKVYSEKLHNNRNKSSFNLSLEPGAYLLNLEGKNSTFNILIVIN